MPEYIHCSVDGFGLYVHAQHVEHETAIMREVAGAYFWDRLPKDIGTAIDVGAHIGAWSMFLKRRNPTAHIAAIEPDRYNFDALEWNTAGTGISIYHAYVANTQKRRVVARLPGFTGRSVVIQPDERPRFYDKSVTYEIEDAPMMVRLIDVIDLEFGGKPIDILKMDCEGCEIDVLQNARPCELAPVLRIVGEYHDGRANFDRAVGKRLRSDGFTIDYAENLTAKNLGVFYAERSGL